MHPEFYHWDRNLAKFLVVNSPSGICRDLILGLASVAVHTLCSPCMLLQWTTTLNFHNLALLIDRLFQNVSKDHSLLLMYLGHGIPSHLLQVWGTVIEKQWLGLLIQMLMHIHLLVCICIPLSIPVSKLECILFILTNKLINPFHRFGLISCFIKFVF